LKKHWPDELAELQRGIAQLPASHEREELHRRLVQLEEGYKAKDVLAVLDDQRCVYVLWNDQARKDVVYCDKPAWIPLRSDIPGKFVCPHHDLAGAELRAERKRDDKKFAGCETRAEILAIRDGVTA
jgi:hypothetical protein